MPWGYVAGAATSALLGSALGDGGAGDASSAASDASRISADASKTQADIAKDQWNYYKTNYQPLETDLTSKASTFGSQEEQDRAAGEAHGDVASNYATQRDNMARNIQSYGINPASGAYNDANLKMGLDEAKTDALAQNTARKGVRDLAFGKQLDVLSVGKGIPAQSTAALASAASNATNASNSNFLQSQILQSNANKAYAPVVNAAKNGVTNWFNTPATPVVDGTGSHAENLGYVPDALFGE